MQEKEENNELIIPEIIPSDILEDVLNDLEDKEEFSMFEPKSLKDFKAYLESRSEDDIVTEFDVLLHDIDSIHAERLNRILGNATDSEFVKIYMKLLEYTKPKVKGKEAPLELPKEATTINIQIVNNRNDT